MKGNIFRILILAVTVSLLFGLVSCSAILEKLPFEIPFLKDKDNDTNDGAEGDLVLIENKKALFQFVLTPAAGSQNLRYAKEIVAQLKKLGIEISEPIMDDDKNKVTDCEIIIGAGVKHRGDELNINAKELGKDGNLIKIVDKKILIAAGNEEATLKLFKSFVRNEMKITDKTTELDSLSVNSAYAINTATDYRIDSIKVGDVEFKDYTIVYDISGMGDFDTGYFRKEFADKLYEVSGCWFKEGSIEALDTYEHAFVISYKENVGKNGFRIYHDGKNLYAECSYANAFEKTFDEYFEKEIFSVNKSKISLPSGLNYEKNVSEVTYRDFGARGDGKSDDFAAILATHEYANQSGQKVFGVEGATYYIKPESFNQSIPVKTDVDFKGATFIVDDRGTSAFEYRNHNLFALRGNYNTVKLSEAKLKEIAQANNLSNLSIAARTTTKLDWLAPYLEAESMVRITNAYHKDYIRHGSNENAGQNRHEVLVVATDGTIDESTPVFFEYEQVTEVTIWRGDETPITFENGTFYNICCQAELATPEGVTQYKAYGRGISVGRPNVTIKNLKHGMADQPETKSSASDENGSFPYGGFISIIQTYNVKVQDCTLAGHVLYFEKKVASGSAAGAGQGAAIYVGAGTYDMMFGDCSHVWYDNVKQENIPYHYDDKTGTITSVGEDDGIGDTKYWGIMCSNFVRNLNFDRCHISRIDAHEGFFNVRVTNSTIGHTFHAVGGGELYVENVTRLTGNSYIVTRGDYGGSFEGDMTIKNGTFKAYASYNTSSWAPVQKLDESKPGYAEAYVLNTGFFNEDSKGYWTWDFGYDCYMPETITMIGSFECDVENLYISANDYDSYWENFAPTLSTLNPGLKPYQLTKYLKFEQWVGDTIPINKNYALNGVYSDYEASKQFKGDYMASNCEITVSRAKEN